MSDVQVFESFLDAHFRSRENALAKPLIEAMCYSLKNGGKRFRPQVVFAAAKMLDVSFDQVVALAAAIECIHTYSLIHDDLPTMDNDDIRRGQPTNHKVYGEAKALLAGDALLTEAFFILAQNYSQSADVGLELVRLVSEAAGTSGMVAGQVEDIRMQSCGAASEAQLLAMLELKTGALIRVCVEGVAVVSRASTVDRSSLRHFGAQLGLAFQLADDLLDYDPAAIEKSGLPAVIGVEATKNKLQTITNDALQALKKYGTRSADLQVLVKINQQRDK